MATNSPVELANTDSDLDRRGSGGDVFSCVFTGGYCAWCNDPDCWFRCADQREVTFAGAFDGFAERKSIIAIATEGIMI